MKVKELIEELKKYQMDAEIKVNVLHPYGQQVIIYETNITTSLLLDVKWKNP